MDNGEQHGRGFVLLRYTHRPQKSAYPIRTSRSGKARHRCAAVKRDPGSSWEGYSEGVGVGDENAESCGVVQLLCIALVIRPLRR